MDSARVSDPRQYNFFENWFNKLDRHFAQSQTGSNSPAAAPAAANALSGLEDTGVDATEFRKLAVDFEMEEIHKEEEERRAALKLRADKVKELTCEHITGERWHAILHEAREAAARGAVEFMLLRFPSDLCSDGGRSINAEDADWPATLRGEAAEVYLRWLHELKPHGFRLAAHVLDFPGGMPGDIGLFLMWGG
jgi:hypothetical protein